VHNITALLKVVHQGKGLKRKRKVLFIDMRKAFDSISKSKLFQIL
jgi:hypothetical protein